MTPAGRFWTAIQNTFSFGLVLGVAWLVVVVLSDLVLTDTAFATALGPCSPRLPPGAPCEWDAPLVWGLQPLYFGAAGLLAGRRTASLWAGARVGAATALLGMGALVLTKVVAVDHGLLPSGLALLAVFGVVGTACGACGAFVDAQLRRGRG